LYRIRRRLLASHDRLDPAAFARMLAWLDAGDSEGEVGAAYLANEPALGRGSSRTFVGGAQSEAAKVGFEAGDDALVAGGLGGPTSSLGVITKLADVGE
jgi:hypothetical protein